MDPKVARRGHISPAALPPSQAEHCPAISTNAAFVCQSKEACAKGYGCDLFSERADAGIEVLTPGSLVATTAEKEVNAAADLVYYNSRGLTGVNGENEDMQAMRQHISSRMSGVISYEDAVVQGKARAILPPEGEGSIVERAAEMAAAEGFSKEESMARALLRQVDDVVDSDWCRVVVARRLKCVLSLKLYYLRGLADNAI